MPDSPVALLTMSSTLGTGCGGLSGLSRSASTFQPDSPGPNGATIIGSTAGEISTAITVPPPTRARICSVGTLSSAPPSTSRSPS